MSTKPATAEEYLAALPEDRRRAVSAVRDVVNQHLPEGYVEQLDFGMLSWVVPLETKPDTYNGKPLSYLALASQKNYMSLYVCESDLVKAHLAQLGKVSCGKGCIRFKRLTDLNLGAVETLLREIVKLRQSGIGPSCST